MGLSSLQADRLMSRIHQDWYRQDRPQREKYRFENGAGGEPDQVWLEGLAGLLCEHPRRIDQDGTAWKLTIEGYAWCCQQPVPT